MFKMTLFFQYYYYLIFKKMESDYLAAALVEADQSASAFNVG
jgi:hypothetical protein